MSCTHTSAFDGPTYTEPAPDAVAGCADCAALGEDGWSHLRLCLSCGHVACCDSSPDRHAAEAPPPLRAPGGEVLRAR